MKRALFPGSFDPITNGHKDIILRALPLFDEIIVGVGVNSDKKNMFSTEKRMSFIKEVFRKQKKIKVHSYDGLTLKYCEHIEAEFILRGLRNTTDFEFEKSIANTNKKLSGIETVFLLSSPKTSFISSGIVREIIKNKGDYKVLVPSSVMFSSK